MLLVNIYELGYWHFHLVRAPHQISLLYLSLVLDALTRLIILKSIIYRVRDLRKGLFLLAVAELLLLHFNLVRNDHIPIQVHRLDQDRHNEFLYNALLLIVNSYAHMGAFVDLVA